MSQSIPSDFVALTKTVEEAFSSIKDQSDKQIIAMRMAAERSISRPIIFEKDFRSSIPRIKMRKSFSWEKTGFPHAVWSPPCNVVAPYTGGQV